MKIEIAEYSTAWASLFEEEKRLTNVYKAAIAGLRGFDVNCLEPK